MMVSSKRRRGIKLAIWYLAWLRLAIANSFIAAFPSYTVRHAFYRWICGIKLGKKAKIMKGVFLLAPQRIEIGQNSVINNSCRLDGRGGLKIGNNVNIAFDVHVYTMSHDYNDPLFGGVFGPVSIEDYVWLSSRCMILPGVTVGYGAVVAAGAVVTKNVDPFTVVAGVPAKPIDSRNPDIQYQLDFVRPWH